MATSHAFYLEVNRLCKEIIDKSFTEDFQSLLAQNHSFISDLNEWINVLKNQPEIVLYEIAFREYQYSLILVSQGFYRQAFSSLRFFIEHSLAALYFSTREMDLRLWMRGQQDIYWSNITDEQNGIFSSNYFNAFSPNLIDESSLFSQIARKIYRECSEYIHGNYLTSQTLPINLEFNETLFRDFQEKMETARVLVVFCLSARYLNFLDQESKRILESNIMDHVGHIIGIQESFHERREEVLGG